MRGARLCPAASISAASDMRRTTKRFLAIGFHDQYVAPVEPAIELRGNQSARAFTSTHQSPLPSAVG